MAKFCTVINKGGGGYCGRFAPSPTGPLHLGSLYTALASYLQAKSKAGRWLLRIDDVDTPRVANGADHAILRALEKFGLHWDGPVAYQSQSSSAYVAALASLDEGAWLYPCVCTRKSLASAPGGENAVYPGYCRANSQSRNGGHALRLRVPNRLLVLQDGVQGERQWNLADEIGDFIVYRKDHIVAYHLATVVDDGVAGVTEVLRGYDLFESTARQILLQQLLDLPTPSYAHIPIIVDRLGAKLSKQNLAEAVDESDPSRGLHTLLTLLRHPPPQEFSGAPPEQILSWAVEAWDLSRLSGTALTAP